MHRILTPLSLVILLVAMAGCFSHRVGDFTALSTKNIYCQGVDVTKLPQKKGVEGKHMPFLGIGANIQDALDQALEAGDGNLMIRAVRLRLPHPREGGDGPLRRRARREAVAARGARADPARVIACARQLSAIPSIASEASPAAGRSACACPPCRW